MRKIPILLLCIAAAGFVFSNSVAYAGCGSCAADKSCVACEAGKPSAECAGKATGEPAGLTAVPEDSSAKAKTGKKAKVFWGNEKCPIMGVQAKPLSFVEYSYPKSHTYGKIHVCCPGCTNVIKQDTAAAYRKAYLDREIKDKKGKVLAKKGQPLDLNNKTCPISGGKVSGKHAIVYNGYKVGLCCPGCEKTFVTDADKRLTKLVQKENIKIPGKKIAQMPEKAAAAQTN